MTTRESYHHVLGQRNRENIGRLAQWIVQRQISDQHMAENDHKEGRVAVLIAAGRSLTALSQPARMPIAHAWQTAYECEISIRAQLIVGVHQLFFS